MRWATVIFWLLATTTYAATPKLFLLCKPSTESFLQIPHVIVLYSLAAIVDDTPYLLETNQDSYLLKAPVEIVADMLEPSIQITINRVTGDYFVFGRNVVKPEYGVCEKTAPKF